jgi:DNA-binding MarR family transcriptional regulator
MERMAKTTAAVKPKTTGCTCLRLRKASRCVTQIYDRTLEVTGMTVTQYSLLGHLAAFDGICIGALAAKLIMDPTTLTRNLRPLLRRGDVAVKSDRSDKRSRRLYLTPKGRNAFQLARPAWARAQHHIEQALGEGEIPALHAALDRVVARLAQCQDAGADSAP